MSCLAPLSEDTVSLLKSSQVVTSVWSAVKELVENSLDAAATNIEVRLEQQGLARLCVRDNGCGVGKSEIPGMVEPHTTSKFREMSDFARLSTYGFRGEALASLCRLSQLTITTRTREDEAATRTSFDGQHRVVRQEVCAGRVGTEVAAVDLFCNLPVRRNFYKNISRRKEELEKVKRLLHSFSICCPEVKFSLHHDKISLWSSLGNGNLLDNVAAVIGRREANNLQSFSAWLDPETGHILETEETELRISGLVPSLYPGVSAELGRCGKDSSWVFVNRRPVECREVERRLREMFSEVCGLQPHKSPVSCVSIVLTGDLRTQLDPNLEPNKQKVGLGCLQAVVTGLETILSQIWATEVTEDTEVTEKDTEEDKENVCSSENSSAGQERKAGKTETTYSEERETPCFNHIGLTQYSDTAESAISEETFAGNSYGLDSLHSTKRRGGHADEYVAPLHFEEESNSAGSFESVDNNDQDHPRESDVTLNTPPPHSPVLRPDMFVSPDLPGVDAVYINRLKQGEFPEPEEDEEVEEVVERERRRHPFINDECEEAERGTEYDESDESLLNMNTPSRLFPSAGKERDTSEKSVKLVKLNPPKTNKLNRSLSVKRNNTELDESFQKIDEFIKSKRARLGASDSSTGQTEVVDKVFRDRRRVNVPFNISKCSPDSDSPEPARHVVARFQSGWIVQDQGDVWLMFPPRLRERILYERLMRSHVMPSEKMSDPLVVFPGLLTEEEARTALALFTNKRQCPAKITDRRITHNGFMLGLYHVAGHNEEELSSFTIKLEAVCPLLPHHGLSDLREVLSLVRLAGLEDSVRRSRPSKVRNYLATEATRLAAAMTEGELDTKAVEEMMVSRREVLGTSVLTCVHDKPLMKLLCTTDSSD